MYKYKKIYDMALYEGMKEICDDDLTLLSDIERLETIGGEKK